MIVFENPGEIDPRLITTFGVNVKPASGAPIGYFGTGLKYALSILLRLNQAVTVQEGERVHAFGLRTVAFRGKDFQVVTMDGADLNFTTEVGKTWEAWMAYRELRSNAVDEGGGIYETHPAPAPAAGVTRVIVEGDALATVHQDRERYFLDRAPEWKLDGVDVHDRPGKVVYYRGIRVLELEEEGQFTYNLTTTVHLTEDRTLRYSWDASSYARKAILQAAQPELVRRAVLAPRESYEGKFDYLESYAPPGETFLKTVADLAATQAGSLNPKAIEKWRAHAKRDLAGVVVRLGRGDRRILGAAARLLKRLGFTLKHQVVVAESLGVNVLGLADRREGKIYVSRMALDQGERRLASTLLEEHLHLAHGLEDNSRAMQDFLLDALLTMGDELDRRRRGVRVRRPKKLKLVVGEPVTLPPEPLDVHF